MIIKHGRHIFGKFTRCAKVCGPFFLIVTFGFWLAGQLNSDHVVTTEPYTERETNERFEDFLMKTFTVIWPRRRRQQQQQQQHFSITHHFCELLAPFSLSLQLFIHFVHFLDVCVLNISQSLSQVGNFIFWLRSVDWIKNNYLNHLIDVWSISSAKTKYSR